MKRGNIEVGLYFDARGEMTIEQVVEYLEVHYSIHDFGGRFDYKLDFNTAPPRGLAMLYPHIVADPQLKWLNTMIEQRYIQSFAVFPAGAWRGYFDDITNERMVRACLQELESQLLALTPANVADLLKQKKLDYQGSYEQLAALVWKVRNDPRAERAYKRIIEGDSF